MDSQSEQMALASRFAPILVAFPEIPALPHASSTLRSAYLRRQTRSASRVTSSAHITRDFYPRSVRLILDNAQPWQPRPPLPLVPVGFTLAYRDYARFFFWPFAGIVLTALLLVALAQGLTGLPQWGIEIGALVVVGALYLITFRSPILVPVDYWHHLNHALLGTGLVVLWAAAFGTDYLLYVAPVVAIPTALGFLTTVALGIVKGLADLALRILHEGRNIVLAFLNREPRRWLGRRRLEHQLFHGVLAPHEYSETSELFFRDPRDGKPMHRADRAAYWAAYARIIARDQYPITYYARVMEPDRDGITVIQYWLCYYYDDWANEHEGDWETVTVLLRDGEPLGVACSQHETGEYRDWAHVRTRGDRPIIYVSAGSHALYFEPGAYVTERPVIGLRVTSLDAEVFGRDVLEFVDFTPLDDEESQTIDDAQIVLIPDPDPTTGRWTHLPHDPNCNARCDYNFEWLNFEGHWGAVAVTLTMGSSGPRGPAFSGLPWDNPRMWAETVCVPCRTCRGQVRQGSFVRASVSQS